MIDESAIYSKFISVVQDAVGASLSQTGPSGSPESAAIRIRANGVKPAYPYITVGILDTKDESGWLTGEYVDPNSESPVYETNKQLLINFRCHGGDALSIINDLHGGFRLPSVLDDVRDTLTGSVVSLSNVDNLPVLLADKYLESASFNLVFNITDTLTDSNTGIIDNVQLDGELHRFDNDPAPLDMTIIEP